MGSYDRAIGPSLTDRQYETLTTAQAVGYYEVPWEGDIVAVAE